MPPNEVFEAWFRVPGSFDQTRFLGLGCRHCDMMEGRKVELVP
jgi:hypothetical protein